MAERLAANLAGQAGRAGWRECVPWRSFSALMLAEIVYRNNQSQFLDERQVQFILERALTLLPGRARPTWVCSRQGLGTCRSVPAPTFYGCWRAANISARAIRSGRWIRSPPGRAARRPYLTILRGPAAGARGDRRATAIARWSRPSWWAGSSESHAPAAESSSTSMPSPHSAHPRICSRQNGKWFSRNCLLPNRNGRLPMSCRRYSARQHFTHDHLRLSRLAIEPILPALRLKQSATEGAAQGNHAWHRRRWQHCGSFSYAHQDRIMNRTVSVPCFVRRRSYLRVIFLE